MCGIKIICCAFLFILNNDFYYKIKQFVPRLYHVTESSTQFNQAHDKNFNQHA